MFMYEFYLLGKIFITLLRHHLKFPTVLQVLQQQGVEKATVRIADRGALECVLRARVETAILRGKGEA